MTLEEALYSYLTADATLAGLVDNRVYPDLLPENVTLPAIAYSRVSTAPIQSRDSGPLLCMARIQFDIYAASKLAALGVAAALQAAALGFKGITDPRVDATFLENHAGDYEDVTEGSRITIDVMIQHLDSFGA